MEQLWEQHKATIRDLYLVKDMTKNEVVEEMARRGFKADEGQFERQFKKWNFRKNLTRKEWQYASRVVGKRKREGKESDLKIDGILIPRKKVQKAISRYGQGSTLEMIQRTLKEGHRERSPTPDGLTVNTPSASVSPGFSTEFLPWLNFYSTIKSHLQSKGCLSNESRRTINHKNSSVWSETVRAAVPVPRLDFGESTGPNLCHDIIQGSGFNKFAFSILLVSNRMDDVFATFTSTPILSNQNCGKTILHHLQSPMNFPVLEFLITQQDETIEALSEVMFKNALLGMNVGLVDLLLRCFKVDVDTFLPGPWKFPSVSPSRMREKYLKALLPLEVAISTNHAPMVRALVRFGADIFATGTRGYTMAILALDSTPDISRSILDDWPDPDPSCAFMKAVCLGLSDDVRTLLAHGLDPNTCDDRFGGPALALAIKMANFHVAYLLLDAEAEVNVYEHRGISPLRFAVEHKNVGLVRRLLGFGAQFDDEAQEGGKRRPSILDDTVAKEDFDMTATLLEYGADPNLGLDPFYSTKPLPIGTAIRRGNVRLAELLLRYGARLSDNQLGAAIYSENSDMIELVLDCGVSFSSATVDAALYEAVRAGNLDLAKRSLNAGADINKHYESPDDNLAKTSNTLLVTAIAQEPDSLEMISFLIHSGADINHPKANPTALEYALEIHHMELIDFLIGKGANCCNPHVLEVATIKMEPEMLKGLMDTITHQGILHRPCHPCLYHRALAAAAEIEYLENVDIILEQCVEIATPCSVHALQRCDPNSLSMLRKLLEVGLPVDVPPNLENFPCVPSPKSDWEPGISPVQHFAMSGNDKAVQLLLDYGADPNYSGRIISPYGSGGEKHKMESVISTVAANCGTDVLEKVLKAGAAINPPVLGDFERTPLQNAAERGRLENMELILRAEGDVNTPAADYGGVTALQAASISGYLGIAMRLLEAGADVNAPMAREEGTTALEGAAEHGRIDMIQLLLSAGADIGSPQFGVLQYERAVEKARKNGHNAAARLLEKHRSSLGLDWSAQSL